jgi:hypothetical protein
VLFDSSVPGVSRSEIEIFAGTSLLKSNSNVKILNDGPTWQSWEIVVSTKPDRFKFTIPLPWLLIMALFLALATLAPVAVMAG